MTIIQSIILGIVEGITEFLPISSTAHIDFARMFLGVPTTPFLKSFIILIQLGAILAVFVLYFKKIFSSTTYIKNIIIAFIPTGIIGFLLYKIIKKFLLANTLLAIIMLIVGGIIILYFEHKRGNRRLVEEKENIDDLTTKELLTLGLAQALAVVPGVSRSGAVIVCGRAIKLSASLITEFSFLLALPTMFFASAYDVYKSGITFSANEIYLIVIGLIVSFLVALLVIKWLIGFVKSHSFKVFGWYRIIFGIILLFVVFFFK